MSESKSIVDILPFETIDQIIDLIADDDADSKVLNPETRYNFDFELPNVSACFLTCRTLASRCRRRIYHSVALFDVKEPRRRRANLTRSFADLVSRTPEVGAHVRELVYCMQMAPTARLVLPIALDKALQNVEKLSLHAVGGRVWMWPELVRSDWGALFARFMRGHAFTSLALHAVIDVNIGDLVTFQNVKSLTLDFFSLSEDLDSPRGRPDCPDDPIELRKLTLVPHREHVASLLEYRYIEGGPILDSRALRDLSYSVTETSVSLHNAIDFLDLTTNLEHLELQVSIALMDRFLTDMKGPEYIPRLLSTPLKTLKSLSLYILPSSWTTEDIITDVQKVLENISAENRVEKFKLHLTVFPIAEPLEVAQEQHDRQWEGVKKGIVDLKWPSLTRAELVLARYVDEEEGISEPVHGPVTFIRNTQTRCLVEVP